MVRPQCERPVQRGLPQAELDGLLDGPVRQCEHQIQIQVRNTRGADCLPRRGRPLRRMDPAEQTELAVVKALRANADARYAAFSQDRRKRRRQRFRVGLHRHLAAGGGMAWVRAVRRISARRAPRTVGVPPPIKILSKQSRSTRSPPGIYPPAWPQKSGPAATRQNRDRSRNRSMRTCCGKTGYAGTALRAPGPSAIHPASARS